MTQQTESHFIEAQARLTPHATALEIVGTEQRVTYGELWSRTVSIAAGLAEMGVGRGDAVAVWLPNGVDWLALHCAAASIGALTIPLNTRYKVDEVIHLVRTSQAKAFVIEADFHGIDFTSMALQAVNGLDGQIRDVLVAGDEVGVRSAIREFGKCSGVRVTALDSIAVDPPSTSPKLTGAPDDLSVVFGTSGTTSFPKLATHTQAEVQRHVRNVATCMELDSQDRVLCMLPFCGTYGYIAVMATLSSGATAVVLPVYQEAAMIEVMDTHRITCLFVMEPTMRTLAAVEDRGEGKQLFGPWCKGAIAGIKVKDVVERLDDRFGVKVVNMYGSSELFAMMASWSLSDLPDRRALAGGRILDPGTDCRVVDPQTHRVVADGESGLLQFRGAQVTPGYLANDAANQQAFTEDGWYVSGDRGRMWTAERVVEYESRLSDTLRIRGYLVSPAEIEELLARSRLVVQASVVGIPDESTGDDRAVAFVQLAGREVTADDLREYCREHSAAWKVPELFVEIDEFPVTPGANGDKIQKNKLRERAGELLAT